MAVKKFSKPQPRTKREAKICIAAGAVWFYVNERTPTVSKVLATIGTLIGLALGTLNYFTSDKAVIEFPSAAGASGGWVTQTAFAEEAPAIDSSFVIYKLKGQERLMIRHRDYPNEQPVMMTVEGLNKVEAYFKRTEGK